MRIKRKGRVTQSSGERMFETLWTQIAGRSAPEPVTELRFHPVRRWRFDFAWPDVRVAVEVDGGVYTYGRHNRPGGFAQDCEKINAAQSLGWVVFRVTPSDLRTRPEEFIAMVVSAIESRKKESNTDVKG